MTKKTRRIAKARRALLTLSLVLVVAFAAVGGTVAWLTSTTAPVTNTFTVGNITIDLNEHKYNVADNTLGTDVVKSNADYKMVPGKTLPKDPYVTVSAGSEAHYLFVEITETAGVSGDNTYAIADLIEYDAASGWTKGTGTGEGGNGVPTNVWFRSVSATEAAAGQTYKVLANDSVTVKSDVSKETMDALQANGATMPKLSFVAYAIQSENLKDGDVDVTDAAGAWALVKE